MNMNKIALTLLTGILTALSLVSCMDDELIKTGNVVEGKPVTVTMQVAFTQPSDIVITRADNTLSDLSNLIIIVYDADNTTFEAMYSSNLSTEQDKYHKLTFNKSETIEGGVLYSVSFVSTSGNKKLIAIANTGADDQAGRIWDLTSLQNNSIPFGQLKEAVIKLQERLYTTIDNVRPIQITSSSQMLMTGWNDNITFGESGNVTSGLGDNKVAVKLNRAMARIKFNIVAKPDGAEGTFTPSSYRIYNIPVNSYLTNTEKKTTSTIVDEAKFIHTSSANIGAVSGGNYSFSFYMPENIYGEIKKTNNNQEENLNYVDRDKWDSSGENAGASPGSKTWTYAPQTSTFVVISGTYSGSTTDKDGQTTNYVGNVEYTVHLGDFSDTESMGNFSIERNCSYTYNMQVLGVDNIIVEVERKDEEPQPGAEGEIYTNTSAYNYLLDAHYEQVYLEYNLSAIAQNVFTSLKDKTNPTDEDINYAIANNLILVVQSPMMTNRRVELNPYLLAVENQSNKQEVKTNILQNVDYKWIEFWPQAEANKIAPYPGVSSWSRADVTTLGLINNDVYGEYSSGQSCTEKSEKLLDVYDVIVAMGNVVKKIYQQDINITIDSNNDDGIIVTKNGNNYVARFTAFVNEYYYYENPSTNKIINTWSEFTNKDTRDMIIAMSTDVSLDGNSTYSKVHSYISQLSIQTFYNSSQAREFNAFGIETYNETPLAFKFNKPQNSGSLSDSDGRSNQLRLMGANTINNNVLTYDRSENWGKYINPESNNGWTKSIPTDRTQRKLDKELYKHQAAYDACMSRNRDLNGDGKIQDNEIRWYLASLNEYIRIGIGSSAISSEARLYMGDKAAMEDSKYPNSYVQDGALYYTSSSDGKRVFWAVEKGPYGPEGGSYSANSVPLRCVRALPAKSEAEGTDISSISGIVAVSTYEKHNATSTTPIVLEFKDRLASSLYRTRIDGGSMIVHNEDSPANLFYEGIYVSQGYLQMSYRLGDIIGYEGTILNPCSEYEENGIKGWRVPNLVEFSALHAAGLITSNASCCTQFSNQNVRYGFAYATSTKNIYCPGDNKGDINGNYTIRCVRDVPEGYTFPTN